MNRVQIDPTKKELPVCVLDRHKGAHGSIVITIMNVACFIRSTGFSARSYDSPGSLKMVSIDI